MTAVRVVAEIGCNHKGDMAVAREMIRTAAAFAGAHYVKFQKRCIGELLTPEEFRAPHPNATNSYGRNYGEHRQYLEFDLEQHRRLNDWCLEFGIGYASSVWDLTSAREITQLQPDYIKVPSASNLNFDMLDFLAGEFTGEIHVSLGMTTLAEQAEIVSRLDANGAAARTVLYACTSGYPVPFDQVCIMEIRRLQDTFGDRVKEIGFSGHHLGIAVDVAAVALGARWIERHFTLNRTWKGTDHAASLEPDGLRKLVRDVAAVTSAMTFKDTDIVDIEKPQREKLKRIPGIHI
jgi:N-acetylneuraminate synthase